jgi:hypothetical protein
MKTYISILLSIPFFVFGCCCSKADLDQKYQPLGPAVLMANNQLMVQYPQGPPDNYSGDDYKNLLKGNYQKSYERLQPYRVTILKMVNKFKVSVFDGSTLVLTDWSCTEGKIDCWSYKKECLPDTMHIQCDQ